MAELPSKGKQPAKRHKPSRLRNEIRPESTDDERCSEKRTILEPHSDTVIPDTQPERNERIDNQSDYGEEVLLSPNSAAFLERNAVKKIKEPSAPAPFVVKLLTKESCGGASSASSPPSPFSFTQAKKGPSKTPPQDEAAVDQSATQAKPVDAAVEHSERKAIDDGNVNAAPAACSPPVTEDRPQSNPSNADCSQARYKLPFPFYHGPSTVLSGSELPEATSSILPSAQTGTRPINGAKNTRTVRKGKNAKRAPQPRPWSSQIWGPPGTGTLDSSYNSGQLRTGPHQQLPAQSTTSTAVPSQQGGQTWPPRPQSTIGSRSQASTLVEPSPVAPSSSHDLSPAKDHNVQEYGSVAEGNQASFAVPDYHNGKQSQDTYTSRVIDKEYLPYEPDRPNTLQHTVQPITASRASVSSQPAFLVPPEHSSTVVPEQPLACMPKQAAAVTPESAAHVLPERHSRMSPKKGHSISRLRSINALGDAPGSADQCPELVTDMNEVQPPPPPGKESEAVLHETSSRGGLHRVSKLRKKTRATGGPLPYRVQVPSMSSNIERSLESLRVALIADQFRTNHENATTAKHQGETIAMLRDQVRLQNDTIDEWKAKHRGLGSAVTRLTDKAKTNQKYAAGLQKDYEKLQKMASSFQTQSKKTLEAKIAEVENEKDSLRRDFEVTLDVLANGQKNLKATVDDLYMRLIISESKKKDFAEDLSKQTAMYEEERKKRDNLEKQLLSSVQSTQHQLGHSFNALVDKLEVVRSSIADVAADDAVGAGIKECLVALHNIQTTPFLTVKDVQKAERMLRFVHERVETELGALSDVVESKQSPTDEIRTFIMTQMKDLRTEMLKYEDVVTENRKAHESNDTLKRQLEAQQQLSQDLEEQIKALRQSEVDLKERASQLERELSDLRDTARDYESDPLELELEIVDLRQQLKTVEDDLEASNTKAAAFQQEATKHRKMYNDAKDMLLKIDAAAKQEKKTESAIDLCAKSMEEYQKSTREKESAFKNEIHRLTIERDEKEEMLKEQQKEVSAAKDQLQMLRKNAKTLDSELETMRKEKMDLETRLRTVQRTSENSPSISAEATRLKEQLRQKTEELQSKTRDHTALDGAYVDLSNRATELQGSRDYIQSQVSDLLSTIETMRQEKDKQISEARKDAQKTVQLAQDQLSTLQKEKQDLLSRLDQVRLNEVKLNNAQATVSLERDGLQKQLTELRAAKDSKDAETRRVHAEAAEEQRKSKDTHRAEIEEWNRRLTQSDASLKEAEARLRRSEAEYRAKLESDRKDAERKVQLLHEEYEKKLQQVKAQTDSIQQQVTRPSILVDPSSRSSQQNTNVGSNRKKVHRDNHTVLNVAGSSNMQHNTPWRASNVSQPELPRTQREDSDFSMSLFEEGAQNSPAVEDMFDDYGFSVVDPAAEPVDDTQEIRGLSMSVEDFNKKMSQVSHHEAKRQSSSSTDLTTISSEEMAKMQLDMHRPSPPMLRGQDRSPSHHDSSQNQKNTEKLPAHSDSISVSGSRSSRSHDRPISQANTASRMMPPPESVSHHFNAHNQLQGVSIKTGTQNGAYEPLGQKLGSSTGTSSPDFMHPPSSASKNTYGHHDPRLLSSIEDSQSPPGDLERSYNQKRKSSISQTKQDTAAKKQRITSQSYLNQSSGPRNSSTCVPKPAVVGPRSKMQTGSSDPQDSTSAASRSKIQPSSSSGPPRTPSRASSSRSINQSRGQDSSSSHAQVAGPRRRTSSRIMKSKNRGDTGAAEYRFDQGPGRR